MGQALRDSFAGVAMVTATALTTATGMADEAPVSNAPEQPMTIQASDLLANDGRLSFSMEAGYTVFNGICKAGDELGIDPEDVQCTIGVYLGGGEHLAMTGREGNTRSMGPDGQKYNQGEAMDVHFDFDSNTGALTNIDIINDGAARFTSSSWDKGIYEQLENSRQDFQRLSEEASVGLESYELEGARLSIIESALQENSQVAYQEGSMRPIDNITFVGSHGDNNVYETNFKLLGGDNAGLDINNADSALAVQLTRSYNWASGVTTEISFHGITHEGMVSDSLSFDKKWNLTANDYYNQRDIEQFNRLEQAQGQGFYQFN